jgi:hypothetical protein
VEWKEGAVGALLNGIFFFRLEKKFEDLFLHR